MDLWGDVGQISADVGRLLVGVAAVGVAGFGGLLLRATRETNENEVARRRSDAYNRERPALLAWIGDVDTIASGATLYVRHLPESPVAVIDVLSAQISEAIDRGGVETPNELITGPWQFKYGVDGAGVIGRTVNPRASLRRGVTTVWALERTIYSRDLPEPWGDYPKPGAGPVLIDFTARVRDREWRYSALLFREGEQARP